MNKLDKTILKLSNIHQDLLNDYSRTPINLPNIVEKRETLKNINEVISELKETSKNSIS